MDREGMVQEISLYTEGGFWKLRLYEETFDSSDIHKKPCHTAAQEPLLIGPAAGPLGLTKDEAKRIAWKNLLSGMQQSALAQRSSMTLTEFVEQKFIPEHVAFKRLSGRVHYHAMLKHVLAPEEVDRVFHVSSEEYRGRLKAVADWPYMGNVRLCDVRPEHVERLTSAAQIRGYSPQTVKHIRNVVSAIFSHAKHEQCFLGDNPVRQVKTSTPTHKDAHTLTIDQAKAALGAMEYPEKEMMLMAIFTEMNISEICGLQWKQLNLTDAECDINGERIAPRTIAVRKQWYRFKLESVQKSREKNLPIPSPLLLILMKIRERIKFTAPDDFVLVSRVGTPINEANIVSRRLKPISTKLRLPPLSWQVFHRTRKALAFELGKQFQDVMAMMVRSAFVRDVGANLFWRCRHRIRTPNSR
jgi:integrase